MLNKGISAFANVRLLGILISFVHLCAYYLPVNHGACGLVEVSTMIVQIKQQDVAIESLMFVPHYSQF